MQVSPSGRVEVASGVGTKGLKAVDLSGGQGLGPKGAWELANRLLVLPEVMLLVTLVLRYP